MAAIAIKRALISVYDKTGIAEFARALVCEFGIEIISTGGTADLLKNEGVPVTLVEALTGFGAMLDGRVKTLHPAIHAAILADRDNPDHMRQLEDAGIKPIDMVVVNLYPFGDTIADPNCTFEQAIEMIDIGGPCMLRAAAKNHRHVLPVCGVDQYDDVLAMLRGSDFHCDPERIRMKAAIAFGLIRRYDHTVSDYLALSAMDFDMETIRRFPPTYFHVLQKRCTARYGENPHQLAAVYREDGSDEQFLSTKWLDPDDQGPGSINNYLDADAALDLCADLTRAAPQGEPRASARAESPDAENATQLQNLKHKGFHPPDPSAPCWLLTWTTYGSWLPGDERGFVSRISEGDADHPIHNTVDTPYDADMGDMRASAEERMAGKPVRLSREQADIALDSLVATASRHGMNLICACIMSNHIHLLCQAAERDGSELLQLFKGSASRELGKRFALDDAPRWWTKSGSKRFVRARQSPELAVDYIVSQKEPLLVGVFEGWLGESEVHRDRSTARAEARGSSCDQVTARVEVRGLRPSTHLHRYACVLVKHNNPCGCGVADDPIEAYRRAYLGDPSAAMGGILACNFSVNRAFAEAVMNSLSRWGKDVGSGAYFIEVWLAPSFDDDAVDLIRTSKQWGKRVRLLNVPVGSGIDSDTLDIRSITGGAVLQTRDTKGIEPDQWKVATRRAPTDREWCDLKLAWLCAKHAKSNAISLVRHGQLLASGAGQTSRVVSCELAIHLGRRNGHLTEGGDMGHCVAASDGFFPFRDGPDFLMDAGVTAIIQPGGSKRDDDTIAACDERGVVCVITGTRHFRH